MSTTHTVTIGFRAVQPYRFQSYGPVYIDTTQGTVQVTLPDGQRGTYYASPEPGRTCRAITVEWDHYQTDETCQYCGYSWSQTRTLGTPRLDSVNCPSCNRLV